MPVSFMSPSDRVRRVVAETLVTDAEGLRAAIGHLVVSTSDKYPDAGAQAYSVRDSHDGGVTVLFADRIPEGQEAQVLAAEIVRHHGRDAVFAVIGDRADELLGSKSESSKDPDTMKKRTWDSAYSDVLTWAEAFPGQAHTLTLSNHRIDSRRYELRLCVRDAQGQVLVATHGGRATRYLPVGIDSFICDRLSKALEIPPSRCRTLGEPAFGEPTYPLYPGDPADWHTRASASTLSSDVLRLEMERDSTWAYNQVLRWAKSNFGQAHTLSISNHHLGLNHYEIRLCVRGKDGGVLFSAHGARALPQLPRMLQDSIGPGLAQWLGIELSSCLTVPGLSPNEPTYPMSAVYVYQDPNPGKPTRDADVGPSGP